MTSRTPVFVAGLVIVVLGLMFSLGWFFVPIDVWLADPSLVPMPEALVGWWIVAIGLALTAWSLRGRFRR